MRRDKLGVPPSLAIAKARKIALDMKIYKDDFKASWGWLSNFRKRRGLGEMLLHGEGTLLGFEEQLLCPEVQEEAGEGFQDLYKKYQALSRSMRALMHSSKAKKARSSRQATLHDMLDQS